MPDPDNEYWWLNTCCLDWEGGFSMTPCCPVNFNACVSLTKTATLCGFNEFNPEETYPNPKKYAWINSSNTTSINWAGTLPDGCDATTGVTPYTADSSVSWNKFYSYPEGMPCELTSSNITWSSSLSGCDDSCSTSGIIEEAGSINNQINYTFTGASCGFPNILKTPDTEITTSYEFIQIYSWTNEGLGGTSTGYASTTTTLSSEDTEDNALDRIEDWTQGNSCVSSDANRGAGVFTWTKTTVKFQGVATGLFVGLCYEGIIEIQQRDAPIVELNPIFPPEPEPPWQRYAIVPIDEFTAGKVFQTFGGGILNVSDEDFIDASFSLNPYDYPDYFPVDPETGILIDPDALVIDPSTSLPSTKGKEYRVLSPILRRIDCTEE